MSKITSKGCVAGRREVTYLSTHVSNWQCWGLDWDGLAPKPPLGITPWTLSCILASASRQDQMLTSESYFCSHNILETIFFKRSLLVCNIFILASYKLIKYKCLIWQKERQSRIGRGWNYGHIVHLVSAMVWRWFFSPPRLVLTFHPHCESWGGQKFHSTLVFRGWVFGKWLGRHKAPRMEPSWLDTGGFLTREIEKHTIIEIQWHKHMCTCMWCHVLP